MASRQRPSPVCPPCAVRYSAIARFFPLWLHVVLNQSFIPPPAVEHQSAVGFPFIQVNLAFSNLSLSDRLLNRLLRQSLPIEFAAGDFNLILLPPLALIPLLLIGVELLPEPMPGLLPLERL